ncbi:hypothetical protein, partial [Candidatus Avelusimicrobium faecicola]|uniref:hypothetical protein n=1 Tax=Candidatus Avelusimicrobium faecicola TaxID=3416205 RepID=UPI003D0A02FB
MHPKPALLFFIAKKTLRAAPCRPHPVRAAFAKSQHPELLLLGRRPKPALLFFIAKKVSKKASPLGTYKTYFEPGVLQLPTVKQIKR